MYSYPKFHGSSLYSSSETGTNKKKKLDKSLRPDADDTSTFCFAGETKETDELNHPLIYPSIAVGSDRETNPIFIGSDCSLMQQLKRGLFACTKRKSTCLGEWITFHTGGHTMV